MGIMKAALASFAISFSLAITVFSVAGNLLLLFSGCRSFKSCCYDYYSFSNILLHPLKLSYDFSQHPLYSCILLNSVVLAITVKGGLFPVENSHNLHQEPSSHEPETFREEMIMDSCYQQQQEESNEEEEQQQYTPHEQIVPIEEIDHSQEEGSEEEDQEQSTPHGQLVPIQHLNEEINHSQEEELSLEEQQEQYTPHEQLVPIEHLNEDSQEEELSLEELHLRIETFISRVRNNMYIEASS